MPIGKYNVAQQVERRRNWLLSADESFRQGDDFPTEVYEALAAQGLGPDHTILFMDETPPQECCEGKYGGVVLTADRSFIRFWIDLHDHCPTLQYSDVTSSVNVDKRTRGIGTTDGWLALQLLEHRLADGTVR